MVASSKPGSVFWVNSKIDHGFLSSDAPSISFELIRLILPIAAKKVVRCPNGPGNRLFQTQGFNQITYVVTQREKDSAGTL